MKNIALTLIATLNDTQNYSSQKLLDTLTGVRAQETDASEITLTDQPTYITDAANAIIAVGDGDFYARYDNALSRGVINGPLKTMALTGRVSNVQMWAADGQSVQLKLVLSKGPGVYAPTTQKGYVSYQDWDALRKELEDRLQNDEDSFRANYATKDDLSGSVTKLDGEIKGLQDGLSKSLNDTQKNLSDAIEVVKNQLGTLQAPPSDDSFALQSALSREVNQRKEDHDGLSESLTKETDARVDGDNRLRDSISQLGDALAKAQSELGSYATSDSLNAAIGKATSDLRTEITQWIDSGNKTLSDMLEKIKDSLGNESNTQPDQLSHLAVVLGEQAASIKAIQDGMLDLQRKLDSKQNGTGQGATVQMVDGGNKTIMDALDSAYADLTSGDGDGETGLNSLADSLAAQEKRMDDLSNALTSLRNVILDLQGHAADGQAATGQQVRSWIDGGNKTVSQALDDVYANLMSGEGDTGQSGLNSLADTLADQQESIGQIRSGLNSLSSAVYGGMMPVGIPFPYPMVKVPDGLLEMVGQPFNPTKFPVLSKMYPSNSLPDMRGVFIRGYDPSGKYDLDGPTRTIAKDVQRASLQVFGGKDGDMVVFSGPGATLERLNMDRLGEADNPPFPYWNGSGVQRINTNNTVGRMRPDNVAYKWVVRAG